MAKDSAESNEYTYRINLCRGILYQGDPNLGFTVPSDTGIHQQRRDAPKRQNVVGKIGFPKVTGTPAPWPPRGRRSARVWLMGYVGPRRRWRRRVGGGARRRALHGVYGRQRVQPDRRGPLGAHHLLVRPGGGPGTAQQPRGHGLRQA